MPLFQRNDQSDLPMPQRAQEIVAEARQRLAASGGKASQLPAMIQRVTQEFRTSDANQLNGRDGRNAMQMPNNIDSYIDQILGMSGMTGGGQPQSAGSDVQLPDEGPTPPDRPMDDGSEINPADADPVVDEAEGSGIPFGQIAAGLIGMGGLYAAGRYLYNRYGDGKHTPVGDAKATVRSSIDESIDAVDGTEQPTKGQDVTKFDPGMEGEVVEQQQPRQFPNDPNTAKQGRITQQQPQSNVDDTIRAIDGEEFDARFEGRPQQSALPNAQGKLTDQRDADQSIQDRVEGRDPAQRPGANRFNEQGGDRGAIIEQASKLPARDAVNLLRENGIELDDEVLRMLAESSNTAKSLSDRAAGMTRGAVRRAIP